MWKDIGMHAEDEVVDEATPAITSVKYITYAVIAISILVLTATAVIS